MPLRNLTPQGDILFKIIRFSIGVMILLSATALLSSTAIAQEKSLLGPMPVLSIDRVIDSTSDHREFDELKGKFRKSKDVTKACLKCHNQAGKQVHKTKHWTLSFDNPATGQKVGAKHIVNNGFMGLASNMSSCSHCHIGVGWKGDKFDFEKEENIDCLICHDTTGTYTFKKFHDAKGDCRVCHDKIPETPKGQGMSRKTDLTKVALNVGPTQRRNCGACHFSGGGAPNAKHGDLSPALTQPERALDVHMDADGENFTCTTCHNTDQHSVRGSRYAAVETDTAGRKTPGKDPVKRGTCRSCHGMRPMKNEKLNDHTDKIACQTCHIPTIARGGYATKTWWDWSKAGQKDADGKSFVKRDESGNVIYSTEMGEARWEENLVPEYAWFNGNSKYTLFDEKIDPTGIVPINTFLGGPDESGSKIWPVKVTRGKQPFDKENNTLVTVNLFSKNRFAKDRSAFWKNLDWSKAIKKGMKKNKREFSGSHDFVTTQMLWPVTHMVAPAENALGCDACHSENSRLAEIKGVYIPNRDGLPPWIEKLMFGFILLIVAVTLLHALGRIYMYSKRMAKS